MKSFSIISHLDLGSNLFIIMINLLKMNKINKNRIKHLNNIQKLFLIKNSFWFSVSEITVLKIKKYSLKLSGKGILKVKILGRGLRCSVRISQRWLKDIYLNLCLKEEVYMSKMKICENIRIETHQLRKRVKIIIMINKESLAISKINY